MPNPPANTPASKPARRLARTMALGGAWSRRGRRVLDAWPVRAAGLVFGLATGLALAAHVAVSTGAIGLGPYVPALRVAVAERAGTALAFGGVRLERREGGGPIELILTDVALDQDVGQVALPDLSLTLDTGGVLRGDVLPRFVAARGGEVTLVRTRTGLRVARSGLAGREGEREQPGAPLALASLVARASEGGFEGVRLTGATLRLRSELSDQSLTLTNARLDVWAEEGGYAAAATAPLGGGRIALRAAVTSETPTAELLLARVPPSALTSLFPNLPLAAARTQVSGDAALTDGRLRFRVRASPGALVTPLGLRPLRTASASGVFDLNARALTIEAADIRLGTDSLAGRGVAQLGDAARFDAEIEALSLTPPRYDAPLPATRGRVSGTWGQGALTYEGLMDVPGGQIAMTGALGQDAATLRLATDDPLTTETLLALWPHGVAPGARDWTVRSLRAGRARGVRFGLRLPRGRTGAPLPDDAVTLAVEADDVTLVYADGLPAVTGARAALTLDLGALTATAGGGRVGEAALQDASVRIGALRTAPTLTVEATARGSAPALLALADAPALGLLGRASLTPAQFDGTGAFTLRLERPLTAGGAAAQVVTGEGSFADLSLDDLPAGIVLTEADGTVRLTEEAFHIDTALDVLGVPAEATLTRSLGAGANTQIVATAELTPSDLDALGLPVRRYASGAAPARFTLSGAARLEAGALALDLTQTRLDVPALGLRKGAGERGAARLDLVLPPGQPVRLSGIKLVTDDVLIEGSARFDAAGGLARLELPRVFSEGHANLSGVLTRRGEGLHVAIDGEYADLSGLVIRALQGGRGGASLPLTLDIALAEGRLRGDAVVTGLRGRAARGADGSFGLDLSGGLGAGRMSFEVAADPDGVGREVVLAADEAGVLLEGLFGITSVEGGAARLRAVAVQDGPLAGSVRAEGITLRDAPLVARLLSVGSLDGLAGVLNGEGLRFDEFAGDFVLEEGTLGLQDVRLTGSALGLSALGDIDLAGRRFDLSGAVAPAYGVNSFLGGIPGLGDLLVSRRGEGVVALGYTVAGPIAEPTVTVNTLSALTPGVFRRLFEPVRERRPSTAEVLEAATREAASREERMTATRAEDMAEEDEAVAETPRAGGGSSDRPD